MKQRIAHGAEIDAVTPDELREELAHLHHHDLWHVEKGVIDLSAGVGNKPIKVSGEYDWLMKRATIGGAGAVNALVLISENDSGSDADLLEVIQVGASGRYSDAFSNDLWIPAKTKLIVSVSNGAAGQVTFNFRVKLQAVL